MERLPALAAPALAALLAAGPGCTWDWDRFEPPRPLGPGGDWQLTFREDCDGTAVDKTKWSTAYVRGGGTFRRYGWAESSVEDDNVSVADGLCTIKMENRASSSALYPSGALDSGGKFEQTHGYFEARMRMARGKGLRTVFQISHPGTWPPAVDVARVSGGDPSRASHSVWYSDAGAKSVQLHSQGDFASDFHVFGVLWSRDEMSFYVDGALAGSVPRNVPPLVTGPLKFELTGYTAVENSDPPDATTPWPAFIHIDWVRAYRSM